MSMSQASETESAAHGSAPHGAHETGHPGPREYVAIAVILAAITAVEVVVYYIPFLRPIQMPIFGVLSLTKFALVAMFFMHLKFDNRFFSVIFVTGLLLACFVFLVVLTMLRIFFVG
jgi:cytochrome c oxidase subunit 4